jgi:hypothetical protein
MCLQFDGISVSISLMKNNVAYIFCRTVEMSNVYAISSFTLPLYGLFSDADSSLLSSYTESSERVTVTKERRGCGPNLILTFGDTRQHAPRTRRA